MGKPTLEERALEVLENITMDCVNGAHDLECGNYRPCPDESAALIALAKTYAEETREAAAKLANQCDPHCAGHYCGHGWIENAIKEMLT